MSWSSLSSIVTSSICHGFSLYVIIFSLVCFSLLFILVLCVRCVFYVFNLQFVGRYQRFVWRGEWKMEQRKNYLNFKTIQHNKKLSFWFTIWVNLLSLKLFLFNQIEEKLWWNFFELEIPPWPSPFRFYVACKLLTLVWYFKNL
jgi:hypothetical protein